MSNDNINLVTTDNTSRCTSDSLTVPGVSEYAPLPNSNQSPPSWDRGPTKEDYNYMQRKFPILHELYVKFINHKILLDPFNFNMFNQYI